jgi:two-component system, NtrC family, sensor kinase
MEEGTAGRDPAAAPPRAPEASVPRRLAAKLILSLTMIVVVAEGIFGFINLRSQERQLLDSMVVGADQLSRSITSATWHAMLADRRDAAYQTMQTIAAKQGIDRIRIFNKEGRVMFSTAKETQAQVDKRAEACFLCHAEAQPLVRVDVPSRARIFRAADGRHTLAMVTPIYNEPACSQAECHAHPVDRTVLGVLDVGLNLEGVDSDMTAIRRRMVAMLLVEISLIALLIAVFTRHFVGRPIAKLIEGTKAVSNMELDRPVEVNVGGELGELAGSFDAMRERLRIAVTDLNQLTQSLEAKVEERTEQLKVAQQKLLQADRLASLGQLAASVAHEVNNPLSGVLNLAVLMQRILKDDGVPHERLPEFRRYLSQIVSETSRAGRIVSDLLSFSRRSRPQAETRADLNAVVRNTVAVVAHKLELANVHTVLDLDDRLAAARGDASQLQQVVMNLVINGAEAMPGGGRLVIRTAAAPDGKVLILEVRDGGVGIPEEVRARIFDPFFTTKEEGKGVGLGLAVVYGIVQAHGGDIDVESAVGEGSTFRVTLPAAPGSSRPASPRGEGEQGDG